MGRGTYTETDDWVAAKISWEPLGNYNAIWRFFSSFYVSI